MGSWGDDGGIFWGFWWDLGAACLPMGSFKGDLGGISVGLGGILGHFGLILGLSLGYLGVILGVSWGIFKVSWGSLSS